MTRAADLQRKWKRAEQGRRIVVYLRKHCAKEPNDTAAARKFIGDAALYEASGFQHDQHDTEPPAHLDPRRRLLWKILIAGPPPKSVQGILNLLQ